jgi:type IV pilus assembly protein PilC
MNLKKLSLSANEKISLVSNMATMLAAGISILEIVDSLLEDAKGNQKKILFVIREDLVQGKHLHASFARLPGLFDKVTVNIIKASEEAGTLEVTLKDLKDNIRKDIEFTDKIRSALMYPAMIVVVFVGVLLMILTFVIPKISAVFLRLRVPLPLPTQVLIFLSTLLMTQTIPVIAVLAAVIGLCVFIFKTKKRTVLNILFTLPVISNLALQIDFARFTRSMFLLLNAGIPITDALVLAKGVILKRSISRVIDRSTDMVVAGKKLSEGFKTGKGIVPTIMIKITEAGERSGGLDKSMQEVSEFMDYEVGKTLQTVTAMLEPIMLVVVGILVGGMMMSIIAPIYGLIGQVGPR